MSEFNYESDHIKKVREITIGYLITGFTIFGLGVILGLLMRLSQSGIIIISDGLWYNFMTLHGDAMFIGFGVFVAIGITWYGLVRSLDAPLHSWRNALIVYWLFIAGLVLVVIGTLVMGFAGSWVFLYPLPFHSLGQWDNMSTAVFVLGVILLGVAIILASIEAILTVSKNGPGIINSFTFWMKKPGPNGYEWNGKPFPIASLPLLVNGFGMLISTIPFALLLIWEFLESFDLVGSFNSLLAKNILWFFGHPVVYQLLFPIAAIYYIIISNASGRLLAGMRTAGFAWFIAFLSQNLVWAHHIYSDFAQGPSSHIVMQLTTYVVTVPSLASLYALLATIYLGAFKWNTTTKYAFVGIIGWFLAGLQGFLNATVFTNNYIHNTLWVVGHFHTMVLLNIGFGFFAFTFYIVPKYTGRGFNQKLISFHFWGSLIGALGMTHLWLMQGLLGFIRRSATLPEEANLLTILSVPFFLLIALVQIFFVLAIWKNIWGETQTSSYEPYSDVSF